jgi:Flp pilus assembly protein TadD
MSILRSAILIVASLLFMVQVALAAPGGGVDGGGGGGRMVPSRDNDGATLSKLFSEGVAFLTEGECKLAEKKFRKVLKKVPRNSEANYLRGISLQCQRNHKSAIRYFKKAKRDDAQFYQAYEALGISYLTLERPDLAERELTVLSDFLEQCSGPRQICPPTLLKSHEKLLVALKRTEGQSVESPDGDQHGLLFDPKADPQTGYLSAVSLINQGRFETAIVELRELSLTLGPHPDVLNYLGYAHRRLGRYSQAEVYYEQALAIDPMHRGANEYLGEMWAELGKMDEARERLAVLERACPFGCAEYEDLKRIIESRLVAAN